MQSLLGLAGLVGGGHGAGKEERSHWPTGRSCDCQGQGVRASHWRAATASPGSGNPGCPTPVGWVCIYLLLLLALQAAPKVSPPS